MKQTNEHRRRSPATCQPQKPPRITQNLYRSQYAYKSASLDRNGSFVKDIAGRFQQNAEEVSQFKFLFIHA